MNNTQQTNARKDELGALWKKKSKNGMAFLSGYVKVDDLGLEKEIKVVVFANSNKNNDKAPDYRIYVSKPLETAGAAPLEKKASSSVQPKAKAPKAVEQEEIEDDIL